MANDEELIMGPLTNEWLKTYEAKKDKLQPTSRVSSYFSLSEIQGLKMSVLDMGELNFPTGWFVIADPLFWLNRDEPAYCLPVPKGKFPLSAAVVEIGEDNYRYAAARVLFSDAPVVNCVEALHGSESLDGILEGGIFGFRVESGWITVMDVEARDAFCDLVENWGRKFPNKNIYDDYLAEEIRKNCQQHPEYQEDGGSWLNFPLFGRDLSFPMFRSGFDPAELASGVEINYPAYYGFDANGEICQLLLEFIDVDILGGTNA
jgi:hypothetical protein